MEGTYKRIQFDEILLLVCIGWRGFTEPWNCIRFYKGILYYRRFQNKADSHLKLKEMPNCSFRGDLLLHHCALAIIVPWDAHQRSPQLRPSRWQFLHVLPHGTMTIRTISVRINTCCRLSSIIRHAEVKFSFAILALYISIFKLVKNCFHWFWTKYFFIQYLGLS